MNNIGAGFLDSFVGGPFKDEDNFSELLPGGFELT